MKIEVVNDVFFIIHIVRYNEILIVALKNIKIVVK